MIQSNIPYSYEEITQHCKMLQESTGWEIMKMQITTKIEMMEAVMWGESKMDESQMLRMRDEHRVLSDLLHLPENLIALYSPKPEQDDHEIYD